MQKKVRGLEGNDMKAWRTGRLGFVAAVLVMSTLGGAVAWGQATSDEILAGNASTAEISGLASNLTDIGTVVTLNDTAFFPASDGVSGIELWKSDGTAAGTVMVMDINKEEDPRPKHAGMTCDENGE
jgi:ELWxxDGT repeat protein